MQHLQARRLFDEMPEAEPRHPSAVPWTTMVADEILPAKGYDAGVRTASMLSRHETTSLIAGLIQGLWFTHLQATSNTFSICSSCPVSLSIGSRTSISLPWDLISSTHRTSSFDVDRTGTGRLPVSSSSRTTPKLYISPLRVATHPCPYSGGI